MSAALIAVVLALVLDHAAPPLVQLRQYGWFERWLGWLSARADSALFTSRYGIVLSLGPLLVLVGLIQWALALHFFGLPGFLFSLAVLFYCWGPRDLDVDVAAIVDADDATQRSVAIQRLAGDGAPIPQDQSALVASVFEGALSRWFGVLFWFLVLGPFGAVLYRFAHLGSQPAATAHLPVDHADAYRRLALILDWPVAQLMTLALALAGNFDAVFSAWRDWHAAQRAHGPSFDHGFLAAAACAGVNCDLAEAREDDDLEGIEPPTPDWPALSAVTDAMSLVWRVLLVWLAVVALFVLAGFVD